MYNKDIDIRQKGRELISDYKFNQLLEQLVEQHRKKVKEATITNIPTQLVLIEKQAESYTKQIIVFADLDFDTRYKTIYGAGELARKNKCHPVAVFFISEMWAKFSTKDKPLVSSRPLEDYADKQELFCLVGMTSDDRKNFASLTVNRIKNRILLPKNGITLAFFSGKKNPIHSELIEQFYKGYFHQAFCEIDKQKN